jgi:cysteinyl-tRNA synthetase, unknown class
MRGWPAFTCLMCVLAAAPAAQAAGKANAPAADAVKIQKSVPPADAKTASRERRASVAKISSWAIQLRYLDRTALAAAPVDMVVIDHAPHPKKDVEIPFGPEQIAPLKVQPNGARRIVLAYLSVGEAERYRYYWKPEWDAPETQPSWLGPENPSWPGDYQVQFAHPEWQSVIFGSQVSYLDRIIAAGFDGVFLDRVDAYQDIEDTVPGSEDAMAGFVTRLADHARRLNPKFLIVMQNAEELVRNKSLVTRLDAIAKEDLSFGHNNSTEPNPPQMVRDTLGFLRKAKKGGLKVLVLEYADTPEKITTARTIAKREGFTIHFTERLLGTLSLGGDNSLAPSRPAAVAPKN